jgi:uncharacterized protein (TIGR02118 family)
MHMLMVLYPVPDDPAAFKAYYATTHVPLAATLPGLRAHGYGYPAALGPGASPHFCVFWATFDDATAMQAALQSPTGQKVAADVPNYSAKGATLIHFEEA